MMDIKWIRANKEKVQEAAGKKKIGISIAKLLEWDDRKRAVLQRVELLRRQRNRQSQEVGSLMQAGRREEAEQTKAAVKRMNAELTTLELELAEAERRCHELQLLVPNIVSPDTPEGFSDEDNVEVRRCGEPASFDFEPLDHVALGELHGMLDIARGVKTGGTRSYYLIGAGVLLHRAVQQLALDMLLADGFTPLDVPLLVRSEAMEGTGFFPLGQDQTYRIAGEDKWLVGTSEASLVSFYKGETVDVAEPVRLAAVSACFRSEVGSSGKDVHGLYRVHQFAKVEQVVICEASLELSEQMLQEITANAERFLQLLELPYRVMAVCAGDMSQKTYKQYDIECWMPSRQAYGETHSSSSLLDFQARRANIRYRDAGGKLAYCHTLNNTAVASPRILIPLLEHHQQADGSIRIPKALQPYMGGMERLVPPGMLQQA